MAKMEKLPGKLVYIALGSNMGDRLTLMHRALEFISQIEGVRILKKSGIIETVPARLNADGSFSGQGGELLNVCARYDSCEPGSRQGTGQSKPQEQQQGDYLNCVCCISCGLTAGELLGKLQWIENKLGRKRPYKWAPRTMDIDILLYGSEIINDEDLKVPHPLMQERPFVMVPLAEIAPELKHPVLGCSMQEICAMLTSKQ